VASPAQSDASIEVELTDGESETYDLLLGADGLHSRIRNLVLESHPSRSSRGRPCGATLIQAP
jgi:2-polyprenyl-6-methoxyphenol hydroxylase-like FAD-dependent oxidoreductase